MLAFFTSVVDYCQMPITRFEKVELLPDVTIQEHIVGEIVAELGAIGALELIDAGTARLADGSDCIWDVCVGPRAQEDESELEFFGQCVDSLLKFAGIEHTEQQLISIMNLGSRARLPMHQDYFEGSRSLLTLAGFKM